ncbi:MAG: hypothetical protein AAF202_06460, partial [Pseudomonadota bacterium]
MNSTKGLWHSNFINGNVRMKYYSGFANFRRRSIGVLPTPNYHCSRDFTATGATHDVDNSCLAG